MKIKALQVQVYKTNGSDCTNGGVSSKYDTLYIPCERGWCDIEDTDERLLTIKKMPIGNNTYIYAEPKRKVKEGNVGYMMGGNFIYTPDSRFPSAQPIAIHDRQETQAQYDANFD